MHYFGIWVFLTRSSKSNQSSVDGFCTGLSYSNCPSVALLLSGTQPSRLLLAFQRSPRIACVLSPTDLRKTRSLEEELHPNPECSSKSTRSRHTEGKSPARFRTTRFCRKPSLSLRNNVRSKSYLSLSPSCSNASYHIADSSVCAILLHNCACYDKVSTGSDCFSCLLTGSNSTSHNQWDF